MKVVQDRFICGRRNGLFGGVGAVRLLLVAIVGGVVLGLTLPRVSAAPEIAVSGNGLSIASGDSTPAESDGTDFGRVAAGQASSHMFTVQNLGASDLVLNGASKVEIAGVDSNLFAVSQEPGSPVPGGGSTTFTVKFTSRGVGVRTAMIRIANNDADENPYTFAIRGISPGVIVAWGASAQAQTNVPSMNSNFVGVAAGEQHSIGVKADGSLVAWGFAAFTNLPSPNSGFVAAASFHRHTVGLKADGSIVAWGDNGSGQTNAPSQNSNFVAVAAGMSHSLGLKASGNIVAWGDTSLGKCTVPSPNSNFVAVSAGRHHSLGLKADGSIVAWGDTSLGKCTVPSPNSNFVSMAAGYYHSLGVKADGRVVAWGDNGSGQCNVPNPNSNFVAVAAGGPAYSLGLKEDGSIVAWGSASVPSPNRHFVAIDAGVVHGLGLKPIAPDMVVGWNGQTITNCDDTPDVGDGTEFGKVMSGRTHAHTFDIVNKGTASLMLTGAPMVKIVGAVGPGVFSVTAQPSNVIALGGTASFTVAFTSAGLGGSTATVSIASNDPDKQPYTFAVQSSVAQEMVVSHDGRPVADGDMFADVEDDTDFGYVPYGTVHSHTYTIQNPLAGDLVLSGNPHVQVDGVRAPGVFTLTEQPSSPVPPGGSTTFTVRYDGSRRPGVNTAVIRISTNGSGGRPYAFVVRGVSAGSVVSWGSRTNLPGTNINFIGVAAGVDHSLGVTVDGRVVAWGDNSRLQCRVPAPNSNFVAVSAGAFHSLGLKADGRIVAWGDQSGGQTNVPSSISDFVAAAAGAQHSLGLRGDGSIVMWGRLPPWGRPRSVPSPNSNFVTVAAGSYHSLGVKADGRVVAWGDDGSGRCNVPSPNINFVGVAGGAEHSLGLKADGSIVAWGDNTYGQTNVPAPNWGFIDVAAGVNWSMGLKADGSIVTWGDFNTGQTNVFSPNSRVGVVAAPAASTYGLALRLAVPEMVVTGNGQVIASGDDTPAVEDDTDFGSVANGQVRSQTFTVQNLFTGDLTLTGMPRVVIRDAAGPGSFTVTEQPGSPVRAGAQTTFTVQFSPGGGGDSAARICIANNDLDDNTYVFAVRGRTPSTAEIEVSGNGRPIANGDRSPDAADDTFFGTVSVGQAHSHTFTVRNLGVEALALSGSPSVAVAGAPGPGSFSVTMQPSSPVAAGTSATFVVRFVPVVAGAVQATVSIPNNDDDENPFTFSLRAHGVAAPTITQQPADASVVEGQAATFSVLAAGSEPFTYQWYRNGELIGGAAGASYTISNATMADSNVVFGVTVSNLCGVVTSSPVRLTVMSSDLGGPVIRLN